MPIVIPNKLHSVLFFFFFATEHLFSKHNFPYKEQSECKFVSTFYENNKCSSRNGMESLVMESPFGFYYYFHEILIRIFLRHGCYEYKIHKHRINYLINSINYLNTKMNKLYLHFLLNKFSLLSFIDNRGG